MSEKNIDLTTKKNQTIVNTVKENMNILMNKKVMLYWIISFSFFSIIIMKVIFVIIDGFQNKLIFPSKMDFEYSLIIPVIFVYAYLLITSNKKTKDEVVINSKIVADYISEKNILHFVVVWSDKLNTERNLLITKEKQENIRKAISEAKIEDVSIVNNQLRNIFCIDQENEIYCCLIENSTYYHATKSSSGNDQNFSFYSKMIKKKHDGQDLFLNNFTYDLNTFRKFSKFNVFVQDQEIELKKEEVTFRKEKVYNVNIKIYKRKNKYYSDREYLWKK